MSTSSLRAAFLPTAALLGVLQLGCSTTQGPPASRPAPPTATPASAPLEPFSWERSTRDLADDLVAEARQLASEGHLEEARGRLDEALCAVLDVPEGYLQRPAYLDYLAMLFAEVAALDEGPPLEPVDELVELPELEEPPAAADESSEVETRWPVPSGMAWAHNRTVESFVDTYTRPGKYRNRIEASLMRSGRYLPMIRHELRVRELPEDLVFLPLIESGFSVSATSPARAHGMWQFIASTARAYGLRVDALVDERRDPVLATRAAVAHLADLHREFGDWELALAAYNSGAGNVRRAIRATGSRDFWTLRRRLPRETRNYVPAFIAAVRVGRDPSRYGLPTPVEEPWALDPVIVDDALDLEVLAQLLGLEADLLRELNPAIRRSLTPASARTTLWLPSGHGAGAETLLASLPRSEWAPRQLHTVRAGETLSAIASRYGTSVAAVRAANGLSGSLIRPGQLLLVPHGGSAHDRHQPAPRRTASNGRYEVRRNDTLWDIARSFNLQVDSLLAANQLAAGAVIQPGQQLVIPDSPGRLHATLSEPAESEAATYRVRSGDTLYGIARRFGTSVEDLRAENQLRGTRILPGEVLRIPGSASRG